jgi:phosphatidylglycerol lysyltransferase
MLMLAAAALWVLQHELQAYDYRDITRSIREISHGRLLLAIALTIVSYAVLTGYDALALRYIQRPLSYGRTALASFLGYVFSYNVGLSILGGSAVRYRLYSAWGLSAIEIAKVVACCTAAFWLGVFTIGGVALLLEPPAILSSLHLPLAPARLLGVVLLLLVGGYLWWGAVRTAPLKFRGWELSLPPAPLSLAQIALAAVDWALAAGVCYVLLPAAQPMPYMQFLGLFLLAQVISVISHVPGGIGVFETVILLFLAHSLPVSWVVGALVAYRGIYYLFPLVVATALLAAYEAGRWRERMSRLVARLARWVPAVAPRALCLTTFLGGALLLFASATPAVGWRLYRLKLLLPYAVIELSPFVSSMVGTALLLLAWGLHNRIEAAYGLTVALLGVAVLTSLLQGFDYEEALILMGILGALLPCRRYFHRKVSLLSQRFSFGWTAAIVLVLLGTVWIGAFAHGDVKSSGHIWRQMVLWGDAPRHLRVAVGAVGMLCVFALVKLLAPAAPAATPPTPAEMARVRLIVQASPHTYAHLALLGDKALLFSAAQRAFLMYSVAGRSWVALGDPIGPSEEAAELIWRFRELCDRQGGWTVFYQVQAKHLPLYLDLGLTLLQLGEEARVPLPSFALAGDLYGWVRQARRLERGGCRFEVVPAPGVAALLPELQRISNAWLAATHTPEKRFARGCFRADYLSWCPVALVRQKGEIVAFANVWQAAAKEELAVDLMRHLPEAPPGVLDYLLSQLMLWGKREGYQWFDLGMVPLSGEQRHMPAVLWGRLGTLAFRHGAQFSDFQALRQYVARFAPCWEPRYLAFPGGVALPHIAADIAPLVAGDRQGGAIA